MAHILCPIALLIVGFFSKALREFRLIVEIVGCLNKGFKVWRSFLGESPSVFIRHLDARRDLIGLVGSLLRMLFLYTCHPER